MSKRFPGRKLSVVRLCAVIVVFAVAVGGGIFGWNRFQDAQAAAEAPSTFAGYVDVTATPSYAFEAPTTAQTKSVVLSFIVADKTDPCVPSWGGAYSLAAAGQDLDLDRRVARLGQVGGHVAVSFGGMANDELAVDCSDTGKLQSAYAEVVDRYSLDTIDLDIEGTALDNVPSIERRAAAIAALQKKQLDAKKPLAVWITLPVAPTGLTAQGTAAVDKMLAAGVDLAGVNIMTMDFGGSKPAGQTMLAASISAAKATQLQISQLYKNHGQPLGTEMSWRKIGLTPMIGQNDVVDEVFGVTDAQGLHAFAQEKGVGRVSMWSLNRDATCSENYPDLTRVSDSCSGIDQGGNLFSTVLGQGLADAPSAVPSAKAPATADDATATAVVDNPSTSPYPIWNEVAAYVAEDRVVWQGNVYEAKWWTQGDIPDNPVVAGGTAPWKLIGPVLPGDRPSPAVTVPAGTFPQWVETTVYHQGDRIMFDGHVFEAKWWTRMDSPEAAIQGSPDSPWRMLKNDAVQQLLASKSPTAAK